MDVLEPPTAPGVPTPAATGGAQGRHAVRGSPGPADLRGIYSSNTCSRTAEPGAARGRRPTATARCSSWPAPAPARPRRSRPGSPACSSEGSGPSGCCCSRSRRRAAREMLSRAELAVGASPTSSRVWGGTFHAVGNRLLRLHGRALGLSPDFTVLDQGDAADVMGLLREELGFATTERRFPRKETLAGDLLADGQRRRRRSTRSSKRHYPWCLDDVDDIRAIFTAYTARKRAQHAARLRRPAAVLARARDLAARPGRRSPRCSTTSSSTSTRTRTRCRPTSSRACGRPAPRATSPSSATTRRRSTGSARRRCATSSSSPSGSRAPRS